MIANDGFVIEENLTDVITYSVGVTTLAGEMDRLLGYAKAHHEQPGP